MLADTQPLSDVALLLVLLVFAVGYHRRQCVKRRHQPPRPQPPASKTTQTQTRFAADRMSTVQLIYTDDQCNMSRCTCTIVLYLPTTSDKSDDIWRYAAYKCVWSFIITHKFSVSAVMITVVNCQAAVNSYSA